MKKLTPLLSFVLLAAFTLQITAKLVVLVHYALNKDYVAKVLCENKNKPKMHCNGKCHLKKQLKEQDKKENSPVNNIKEKYEVQFFSDLKYKISPICVLLKIEHFAVYTSGKSSSHLLSVFHPPQA